MYGAILGDLAGFPCENHPVDLTDRNLPLIRMPEEENENTFSDKTVLTTALEEGLLCFERRMPEILAGKRDNTGKRDNNRDNSRREENKNEEKRSEKNDREESKSEEGDRSEKKAQDPVRPGSGGAAGLFEEILSEELTTAFRRFGTAYPLAGYTMDTSIWLFREGTAPGTQAEAGPAARVSPIAWMFQDDLYMMRHMARLQASLTNRSKETVRAADAAACLVFLALHGCTKDYMAAFMGKEFGYRIPEEEAMRGEVLSGGRSPDPGLCVRAALTAFLYGTDFEDVLRRAVSMGGSCADIAAIAGAAAEAFFGMPEEWKETCRQSLPDDLRAAADTFAERMEFRRRRRETDPAARKRWENALIRASERHPAAVQGNEELEDVIAQMLEKRDQQSLLLALEMLRRRMQQKGRVLVPLLGVRRAEAGENAGMESEGNTVGNSEGNSEGNTDGNERKEEGQRQGKENAVVYRLQTLRTRDGKLWQPAYTSRGQLEKGRAFLKSREEKQDSAMALSWSIEALLRSFLPDEKAESARAVEPQRKAPPEIAGIVLNPYDKALYLPRKTIEAVLAAHKTDGHKLS